MWLDLIRLDTIRLDWIWLGLILRPFLWQGGEWQIARRNPRSHPHVSLSERSDDAVDEKTERRREATAKGSLRSGPHQNRHGRDDRQGECGRAFARSQRSAPTGHRRLEAHRPAAARLAARRSRPQRKDRPPGSLRQCRRRRGRQCLSVVDDGRCRCFRQRNISFVDPSIVDSSRIIETIHWLVVCWDDFTYSWMIQLIPTYYDTIFTQIRLYSIINNSSNRIHRLMLTFNE